MKNNQIQTECREPCVKRRLPLVFKIFFGICALSVVLYIVFLLSERFADFFNRYISSVIRAVLAHATSWIPFSLAEFILILSPVILIAVIRFGLKKYADCWRDVFIYCGALVSVLALVLSIFVMGFAPAYRGATLDKKLGIERRDVSSEELYATAEILTEKIREEYSSVYYSDTTDFSVMPYDFDEMNDKLLEAYDRICDKYSFVQKLHSRVKPVMLSEPMSYTHITGVYSFFTGEANININFPDYTIPFTAAHELAHQRGIAREDEANFMAFLVCIEADSAYIRYSGYLQLYEYVASSLADADLAAYIENWNSLPLPVQKEIVAFGNFFKKYQHSKVSEVTDKVNDKFLTSQGTAGTKSYGMVVDLAVAYYIPTTD